MSIKHSTQPEGSNNPAYAVSLNAWNVEHDWIPVTSDDDIPDGQCRVVDTGVSPARTLALKYNDGGLIRTIASITFALLFLLLSGTALDAKTWTLCESGCDYVNTGANLQTVINAAAKGDTILLQENTTYSKSSPFNLPAKTCAENNDTCYITIKTGVKADGSLMSASDLPATDVRITAAYTPKLAKLACSTVAENEVVRTYTNGTQVRYWALKQLEVIGPAEQRNNLVLVSIGSWEAGSIPTRALIPDRFIFDQVYLHGYSQTQRVKRGIAVGATHVWITNSTIDYIGGTSGTEGQTIHLDTATDVVVTNNYLRGGAETFMSGGSSGLAYQNATVTAQSDSTHLTVSDATNLVQGQDINIKKGGYRYLTTISAIDGNNITISPGITPEVDLNGTAYRVGGVLNQNLTFTKNYVTHDTFDGTAGPPSFLVKNVFELKNMDTATIEGNVFEYSWNKGQNGNIVLFTPQTQNASNPTAHVANITFRKNIIRHGTMAISMTGGDSDGWPSGRTSNISMTDNLMYDISRSYHSTNDSVWGLQSSLATVSAANSYTGVAVYQAATDVTFSHNTVDSPGAYGAFMFDALRGSTHYPVQNLTFQNNFFRQGTTAGFGGTGTCSPFSTCWDGSYASSSGSAWSENALIGGSSCGNYPTGTTCPTVSAATTDHFVDYAAKTPAGFVVKAGSVYKAGGANDATDGEDLGADIAAITALTDIAESGNNSGGVAAPTITTESLPGGTVGTAYSQALAGSAGTAPYSWSVTVGALPAGLTLTDGTISGTPTTTGTATFTVQLTDQQPVSVTKALSITITGAGVTAAPRPLKQNGTEALIFARASNPFTDGESIRLGDFWIDISSTPVVNVATNLGPPVVWTNVSANPATANFKLGTFPTPAAGTAWTVAGTTEEMFDNGTTNRLLVNLTGMSQCRIWANITTTASGVYAWLQYSTNMATWADLGTDAESPYVTLASANVSTMYTLGSWATIQDAAKGDVWLRVIGNGTGTVNLGLVGFTCKP